MKSTWPSDESNVAELSPCTLAFGSSNITWQVLTSKNPELVLILEVCWDNLRTLSFGLSQLYGHGSWLVCEVALSYDRREPTVSYIWPGWRPAHIMLEGRAFVHRNDSWMAVHRKCIQTWKFGNSVSDTCLFKKKIYSTLNCSISLEERCVHHQNLRWRVFGTVHKMRWRTAW